LALLEASDVGVHHAAVLIRMDIEFEEFRNELNLTISVLLEGNSSESAKNRILEIQNRLVNAFDEDFKQEQITRILTTSALENWKSIPEGRGLYICPWKTLHFSMLNCISRELQGHQFQSEGASIKNEIWFEGLKKFVCANALSRLTDKPHTFTVRGIYSGAPSPSVALKAYPEDDSWLRILREFNRSLGQQLGGIGIPNERKDEKKRLKLYWDGNSYFSINIVRFLRAHQLEPYDRPNRLSEVVVEQDRRLRNEPIVLGPVKPVLVISNAYLSNAEPELHC
jgi:hypothetical protein